jgi:hypothetical protein
LLGEAGWRRADSQKPELLTMSEQYDECSDSARFKRPRWAAEWCTWWRNADRTYVDKRTHEAVVRARRKFPQFASVTRSIEKASGYTEIGRQVNEALRRSA